MRILLSFFLAGSLLVGAGCAPQEAAKGTSLPIVPPVTTVPSAPSTASSFTPDPLLAHSPVQSDIGVPAGDVLNLAKTSSDSTYDEAVAAGAQIIPVDNNRSFVVWYAPSDFDPKTDTVLVSLHGHGGWATKDFTVWKPLLDSRHYAYVGIQWWFGRSLESEGYYKPDMIYGLIRDELVAQGIPPGHVIFEAFSMGSANSYAVTAFDRWESSQYFAVTISNAGPYESDFPPNAKIPTYSEKPFEGVHWILYCAGKDEEHGCDKFSGTKTFLDSMGATIDLFIQDPTGGHGSFMINPSNANKALDVADGLIK